MRYHGSCHCGRIAFDVVGELDKAIDCNCSHCSRKGYLLWFVPREQLKLATPEQDMASYTFNRRAIQHRFCPTCGCAPFGLGNAPDGKAMAAINVRCLDDVDLAGLQRVSVGGRSL
jgi:hypothetical protein